MDVLCAWWRRCGEERGWVGGRELRAVRFGLSARRSERRPLVLQKSTAPDLCPRTALRKKTPGARSGSTHVPEPHQRTQEVRIVVFGCVSLGNASSELAQD
eukprot:961363-Pyramimonas_sp.AAC.1